MNSTTQSQDARAARRGVRPPGRLQGQPHRPGLTRPLSRPLAPRQLFYLKRKCSGLTFKQIADEAGVHQVVSSFDITYAKLAMLDEREVEELAAREGIPLTPLLHEWNVARYVID